MPENNGEKPMECLTCEWKGKEKDCLTADRYEWHTGQLFELLHCPVCYSPMVAPIQAIMAS